MKTNLIKTELTHAQILNPQLNGGYYLNPKSWYTIIQMKNTLPSTDYRMSLWPIPLWQRIPISSMVLPSISSRINYR